MVRPGYDEETRNYLHFPLDWHLVVVIATFLGGQFIENNFLTPKIVGNRVGLHPMVVMISVIVFGNLMGVWGLVIAVPVTAALMVIAAELVAAYRRSSLFTR